MCVQTEEIDLSCYSVFHIHIQRALNQQAHCMRHPCGCSSEVSGRYGVLTAEHFVRQEFICLIVLWQDQGPEVNQVTHEL